MVDAVNFRVISDKLSTSGVVNPASFPELYHNGYRMIIDLRSEEEKSQDISKSSEDSGIKYISIPVKGMAGLGSDQAKIFEKIFENNDSGAILLCCATANRAGAMWAAYNILKGANIDDAMSRGKLSGMGEGWEDILDGIGS